MNVIFSLIIDNVVAKVAKDKAGKFISYLMKKKPEITVVLILGIILIFASSPNNIAFQNLPFKCPDFMRFSVFIAGCVITLVAIILFIYNIIYNNIFSKSINLKLENYIEKDPEHEHIYSIRTKDLKISYSIKIIYGSINNIEEYKYDNNTLVVLSTDYNFSDDFMKNPECVLSSFVSELHPSDHNSFKKLLNDAKRDKPEEQRYVYLDDFKSGKNSFNIGIVAVPNKDNKETNPENVMLAFNDVYKIATENKLTRIYIPLIGSNNEGLSHELSFLTLLISILKNKSGVNLPHINIVIYESKRDNKLPPISEEDMKAIVNFVLENR